MMKAIVMVVPLLAFDLFAQTPSKSLEICGSEFSLGMTWGEVLKHLVLPTNLAEAYKKDKLAVLTPDLFGLPDDSQCGGELHFTGDRVSEVKKLVSMHLDSASLLKSLFLQINNIAPQAASYVGADAVVNTVRSNFHSDMLDASSQIVILTFGSVDLEIDAEQQEPNRSAPEPPKGLLVTPGLVELSLVIRSRAATKPPNRTH